MVMEILSAIAFVVGVSLLIGVLIAAAVGVPSWLGAKVFTKGMAGMEAYYHAVGLTDPKERARCRERLLATLSGGSWFYLLFLLFAYAGRAGFTLLSLAAGCVFIGVFLFRVASGARLILAPLKTRPEPGMPRLVPLLQTAVWLAACALILFLLLNIAGLLAGVP